VLRFSLLFICSAARATSQHLRLDRFHTFIEQQRSALKE
jgi:hypothetical protein